MVAARQLDGHVVAEPGGAVPDVDDDVEDAAAQAAYELAHRRVPLEMQTAHHAAMRDRLDGLFEIRRNAQRFEILAHPRLHEEPPLVGEVLRSQDLHPWHLRGLHQHCNLRARDAISPDRAESNHARIVPRNPAATSKHALPKRH